MIGYLDMPAGISGDMFLGCLVDCGWGIEQLREVIRRLHLPEGSWSVEAKTVMKGALRATLVDVLVEEGPASALPKLPAVPQAAIFTPAGASHGSVLTPHAHGGHGHRNLHDIAGIIGAADLSGVVKERALAVFKRLAHAEAAVHGTTVDQIHFHEVGALDAIVDIVGTCAGVDALGITKVYASPLPTGKGWTNSAHGKIPLPAPATLEILAAAKAPTCAGPGEGELVTPTGAALVAELARSYTQPPMHLQRVGIGAGMRDCAWPNVARLWVGEAVEAQDAGQKFVELETNIDDMTPQLLAAAAEQLLAAGARDVWLTGVQMKKGRPGVMLSVIADAGRERDLADLILRHTTTLGVRVQRFDRYEAQREMRSVETAFGPIAVKVKLLENKAVGASPEYEDCRKAAAGHDVPVRVVYEAALAAAQRLVG